MDLMVSDMCYKFLKTLKREMDPSTFLLYTAMTRRKYAIDAQRVAVIKIVFRLDSTSCRKFSSRSGKGFAVFTFNF